jgi:hippurate hydrolase
MPQVYRGLVVAQPRRYASRMSLDLIALYQDLHRHPELGFTETRTAGVIAAALRDLGLDVTEGVGGTGVVGVLINGMGPVVGLRADIDALPIKEQTGLSYASEATALGSDGIDVPVMHACGHDMHVTWLLGALERLAASRTEWSGTVVAYFQPAEELVTGAQAMVDDGVATRFPRPVVVLGQHLVPIPAGLISLTAGPAMAGADSLTLTFHGRGGHGSQPHRTVDPIVAAASAVTRLQTIVAREVEPGVRAVVTVGTFHAGTKSNIIPADAELGISVRSETAEVRERVLASLTRLAEGEAKAAGMTDPPTIVMLEHAPPTINDGPASERVRTVLRAAFGDASVTDIGPVTGSEDVSLLATASGAPLVFWFTGGADPAAFATAMAAGTVDTDIPSNHSPFFAPVLDPTIDRGVAALVVAAREFLG